MQRLFYFLLLAVLPIAGHAASYSVPGTNIVLSYRLDDAKTAALIVGCNYDASGHAVVPATLEGRPVKEVRALAFRNCTSLTAVTLPDSIQVIEYNAFINCPSITSMNIPESLVSLGANAVSQTSIPFHEENQLKYVMNSTAAFLADGSAATGTVVIPSEVAGRPVISVSSFGGNPNLTDVTVPGTVTTLGKYAFGNSGLSSVTLSEGVAHIDEEAFSRCASLQNVSLPSSLRTIQHGAFRETRALYDLTFPEGVTEIRSYAFSKSNIKRVSFPSTLSVIDDFAFIDCVYLESIDLTGTAVTRIGRSAFDGCRAVTSAIMGDSVITIGAWAFRNAADLASIDFGSNLQSIQTYAFTNCDALTEIALPDSLLEIGSNAFRSSGGLSEINFGNGLTRIGYEAFKYCRALDQVILPDSLTTLEFGAFSGCSSLKSIMLSNQLGNIERNTFSGCLELESISLPDSVTSIGERAFVGCSAMATIAFGANVADIGEMAFFNCDQLTIINLPDSLVAIGTNAFRDCDGITDIQIPASVTTLGEEIFSDCTQLSAIHVATSSLSFASIDGVIYDAAQTRLISYPPAKAGSFVVPDHCTEIADSAFKGCNLLSSVRIPDSVTHIGTEAFRACSTLGQVILPNSITWIRASAFEDCGSLNSITIPENVIFVGEEAFKNCSALTRLVFDGDRPAHGTGAFSGTSYSLQIYRYEGSSGFDAELDGRSVLVLSLEADEDGDGSTNNLERLAGTDSFDPQSRFTVGMAGSGQLRFTPPRHPVQVECFWSEEPSAAANWTKLNVAPGDGVFDLPPLGSPPFDQVDGNGLFFKVKLSPL